MNILHTFCLYVSIIILCFITSCTNLDEVMYSTLNSNDFYKTESEVISALGPAYSSLKNLCDQRGILIHEEATTDILCPVTRDYGGWYDGGHSQKYHEHTWTPETGYMDTWWTHGFEFVNQANRLKYQLNLLDNFNQELKTAFDSELSILRAFGYYYLLNDFGNVPIVDRFDVEPGFFPENNSDFNQGRREVFDFIENDITASLDNLSDEVDASTYGRFNKFAALALLSKLYMNSEVWTGVPRWSEAITQIDQILNSNKYELESDYFSNFTITNDKSKEIIFAVPFDATLTGGNMSNFIYVYHHHFNSQSTVLQAPRGANNGATGVPSFIHSFDKNDTRLKGWNFGPQYVYGTDIFVNQSITSTIPLYFTIDFDDPLSGAQPGIEYDYRNAPEGAGARPAKYEINYGAGTQAENDLVVYRLADFILLKAEAIMRNNAGQATQEAVDLVNLIVKRAFENPEDKLYTVSTLTLDEILNQRGWELYYEGHRRNDLIRYDKFAQGTWEWYDRSNHGDYRNYFPIPQSQINSNPKLHQNPGY